MRAPLDEQATKKTRGEIVQIADIFRANIVDDAPDNLVLEITGTVEEVDRLLKMLDQFGVSDVQRTGVIAMLRGGDENTYDLSLLTETTRPNDGNMQTEA